MGMSVGSNAGSEPEVMMDINTTPLIDVMLVLLIMLIITIPPQLHSINLDMPVSAAAKKSADPVVIKVDINEANQIVWDKKVLQDRAALEAALDAAAALEIQPELHIKADGKAKYEVVAAVLAGAQRRNLNKLGIVGTERFAN